MAKAENYDDLTLADSNFIADLDSRYTRSSYTNTDMQEADYEYIYYSVIGENGEHYQIQIGLRRYYLNSASEEIGKTIKVVVFYPIGNNLKTIDISWAIAKT